MSYQERRALVNVLSTVLITAGYTAYMMQRYPQTDPYSIEVFRFWGGYFLILIPVTIIARIIITIIFSILNTIATREGEPEITDERDRLIELKSLRASLYVVSIGLVAAIGSLAFDAPPAVMFALLVTAGIAGEIVSEVLQFFFYRRGF